jgi:hypothetical protein
MDDHCNPPKASARLQRTTFTVILHLFFFLFFHSHPAFCSSSFFVGVTLAHCPHFFNSFLGFLSLECRALVSAKNRSYYSLLALHTIRW